MFRSLGFAVIACIMNTPSIAQTIIPGKPDVVWGCYSKGQPSSRCIFECTSLTGTAIHRANNVSRVELYSSGKPGRVDTRSWIAYRWRQGELVLTDLLYTGPTMHCIFPLVRSDPNYQGPEDKVYELRVEQFDQ